MVGSDLLFNFFFLLICEVASLHRESGVQKTFILQSLSEILGLRNLSFSHLVSHVFSVLAKV